MNMNISSILIEFDALFDIDLAICKIHIRENKITKYITETDLIQALINREYESPLSLFIDDKEESSKAYHKYLETRYDDIIDIITPNNILKFLSLLTSDKYNQSYKVTILLSDDKQKAILEKFKVKFNILVSSHDEADLEEFDQIIIKSLTRALVFKKMSGKRILALAYKYNLEENKEKKYQLNSGICVPLIMNDNRVSAIVPYANYKYDFLMGGIIK